MSCHIPEKQALLSDFVHHALVLYPRTLERMRCGVMQHDLVEDVAGIDTIPDKKIKHDVQVAISNSFGFGGHNSVVAFAPYANGKA